MTSPMPAARSVAVPAAAIGSCALVGYALSRQPTAGALLIGVALGTITVLLAGIGPFATIVLSLLPWLVLIIDFTPAWTLTVGSALAAGLLLHLTPLRSQLGTREWVGVSVF